MSITNINNNIIETDKATKVNDLLAEVISILTESALNLGQEDRTDFGSINERNKLITNKVMDYHERQPALDSSDVDWPGMETRFAARKLLESAEEKLDTIRELSSDQRITYDYFLYKNCLTEYDYAKYKASRSRTGGWQAKVEDLKQFFPNPGGNNGSDNNTPAA